MNVPLADLHAQYLTIQSEIDSAIKGVIESSQFILGRAVAEFEKAFAQAHQVRHCIGVGSGTDALHATLWALGLGPGDAVVTTPFTFIATAEAISLVGALPVFVDIDPRAYTMDPGKLQDLLRSWKGAGDGRGTLRAVIPVHLYGHPAPMREIGDVARSSGLYQIEDACQSHLASIGGTYVGNFGEAACFSFYPGKNLGAYGEAGAVLTNDDALAEKIRLLRDHGQSEKYSHRFRGHNYRMDGIQGAVLGVKLKHLERWTSRRREIARTYREELEGVGDLRLPCEAPNARHVYHLFVLRTGRRDALRRHLADRGIATALHYPIPLHFQQAYRSLGYGKGDFPVSEAVAEECCSLPLFPEMTTDQIDHVVSSVRSFFAA